MSLSRRGFLLGAGASTIALPTHGLGAGRLLAHVQELAAVGGAGRTVGILDQALSIVQTKPRAVSANTSISQTFNAQPKAGNLLVAAVRSADGTAMISTQQSGWHKVVGATGLADSSQIEIWRKLAGPSESSTVTFDQSLMATMDMQIWEIAGVVLPVGAAPLGTFEQPNLVIDEHVATTGSDVEPDGDGSLAKPWATLSKAFDECPNNGWIAIRGGTYTNQNFGTKTGKTVNVVNYPGEAVTYEGSGTTRRLISFGIGTEGTSVRGIRVQNYLGHISDNSSLERAPVTLARGGIVEHCHFVDNGFNGLRALSPAGDMITIRHCTVSGSGREGIAAAGFGGIFGTLNLERCHLHNNGTKPMLPSFAVTSAGAKVTSLAHGNILHNDIHDNVGKGFWADVQCQDFLIYGNYCHHNTGYDGTTGDGIFYEISADGFIVNNLCLENSRAGIHASTSHNVYIMHNALFRNRAGVWIRDGDRFDADAGPYNHPDDNFIHNNTVGAFLTGGTGGGNSFFRFENPDNDALMASYGIILDWNHYWRPVSTHPAHISRIAILAGDQNNSTFAAHQTAGHDGDGSFSSATGSNPLVRGEVVQDWRLPAGHPQEDAAVALPEDVATRLGIADGPYPPGPLTSHAYVAADNPVDRTAANGPAASNSITTGSTGALSQANEVAIAACCQKSDNGGSEQVDSAFTLRDAEEHFRMCAADRIVSSTAALNPTFSWASVRKASAVIATFRGAIGLPPG